MKRFGLWVVALGTLLTAQGCAALATSSRSGREPLPHFSQVDAHIYRGAQPTTEGYQRLAALGVKTVIDLRLEGREAREERQAVEALGMRWVHLPMHAFWRPSDAQIREFLKIVSDPAAQPVFVHCRQGRNRTGLFIAIYRIVHDAWMPARAYAEATSLGLSPWNTVARHILFREAQRKFTAGSTAG